MDMQCLRGVAKHEVRGMRIAIEKVHYRIKVGVRKSSI